MAMDPSEKEWAVRALIACNPGMTEERAARIFEDFLRHAYRTELEDAARQVVLCWEGHDHRLASVEFEAVMQRLTAIVAAIKEEREARGRRVG